MGMKLVWSARRVCLVDWDKWLREMAEWPPAALEKSDRRASLRLSDSTGQSSSQSRITVVYVATDKACVQFVCGSLHFVRYCLSNAMHSSQHWTEHKITWMSSLRCPVRVSKTSNGHNSAMCHPIDFVFGSRPGFLARTDQLCLTAHELHELHYDRPTSQTGIGQTPCSFEQYLFLKIFNG